MDKSKFDIQQYITPAGKNPYREWYTSLKDRIAKVKIGNRINRIAANGNFGDHAPCGEGVWELRIDEGPGYRVYYAQSGKTVIILFCGGDKRKQNDDIKTAKTYWQDWQAKGKQR